MFKNSFLRAALTASLSGSALAGCSGANVTSPVSAPVTTSTATRDLATLQAGAAEGQLFCQAGPAVLAMFDPSGAAILAKGATATAVKTACNIVGGAAVALQNVSVTPQGVQVTLPSTLTIPTKAIS